MYKSEHFQSQTLIVELQTKISKVEIVERLKNNNFNEKLKIYKTANLLNSVQETVAQFW